MTLKEALARSPRHVARYTVPGQPDLLVEPLSTSPDNDLYRALTVGSTSDKGFMQATLSGMLAYLPLMGVRVDDGWTPD
jgi:hypothetical protein